LLCIVDELEDARLDADGLHTSASDAIDQHLSRRRAAEAERRRVEAQARARARRAAEAQVESRRTEAKASVRAEAPPVAPRPARVPASEALPGAWQEWPCDLQALRRLLGDEDLARRVEQPLSTDVECNLPPAIWHLMAVLELRNRGGDAHPLAIRAAIAGNGCGYSLTGEAIAGVIAVAHGNP
jgi:hypothetical protein